MRIRAAAEGDWPTVHRFFREIVDACETCAYPEGLSPEAVRRLRDEAPPGRTVVAVDDEGQVVGSARVGPNRPARGGQVVDWAKSAGYRGIRFNAVVETNTPAVSLWRSLDFRVSAPCPAPSSTRGTATSACT